MERISNTAEVLGAVHKVELSTLPDKQLDHWPCIMYLLCPPCMCLHVEKNCEVERRCLWNPCVVGSQSKPSGGAHGGSCGEPQKASRQRHG